MFIYQDGKLYFQEDNKELVGVEIYSDQILKLDIKGEVNVARPYEYLGIMEVRCRFEEGYKFPVEAKAEVEDVKVKEIKVGEKVEPIKEVVINEPTDKPKRTTRKSTGK